MYNITILEFIPEKNLFFLISIASQWPKQKTSIQLFGKITEKMVS